MKLIKGVFKYGETIEIEYNGKIIKRKVRYDTLNGLYVIIDYEKIGESTLRKG